MTLFKPHLKIEEVSKRERDQIVSRAKLTRVEMALAVVTLGAFYITLGYGLFKAFIC